MVTDLIPTCKQWFLFSFLCQIHGNGLVKVKVFSCHEFCESWGLVHVGLLGSCVKILQFHFYRHYVRTSLVRSTVFSKGYIMCIVQ